jgi:hypothetical protein
MNTNPGILALLLAGCAATTSPSPPWEYKATTESAYTRISAEQARPLVRRAEDDFRASPPFPDSGPMPLLFIDAIRRTDGRTLVAFYMGVVSDVSAIYIFDSRGNIEDRYLHSWWRERGNRPRD